LSKDSARLYDFQVETLFLGSADTMRRQALPFVAEWMRGRDESSTKLLDVASGTGRFLTFVRDNYPGLQCTALELSPHYLEAVRKNNARFEGGPGSLTLVEANCEAMPFPDASFDAVTNVYLFHEMPREARRNAAREFARVLKPGGKLFFVDSAQVGDGRALGMEKAFDQALERFPQFNHEPYYKDYSVTDLKALFGEFGLEYDDSTVAWVSKCWSFTKKEESREDAAPSAMSEASAESAVSDEAAAEKVPEAAGEESSAGAAPAAEAAAEAAAAVERDAVLYEFDADEDAAAKEPEAGAGAD
jgi:ubiquinone/menaquinone biosynthesis C-methylase UbiE